MRDRVKKVSWDDITDKPAELGGDIAFSDLTDGFALTGNANKVVGVNSAGNALEPKTISTGAETPQTLTASTDLTSADDLDFGLGRIVELNLDANKDLSAYLKVASVVSGVDYILRVKATGANRILTAGTSIDLSDFDSGVFNIDQNMLVEFKLYLYGSDIILHAQNLAV